MAILEQFISELNRRNKAHLKANDPNYQDLYGEDEDDDTSLPPLGPAVGGNKDSYIYDNPDANHYAVPMLNNGAITNVASNTYAVS